MKKFSMFFLVVLSMNIYVQGMQFDHQPEREIALAGQAKSLSERLDKEFNQTMHFGGQKDSSILTLVDCGQSEGSRLNDLDMKGVGTSTIPDFASRPWVMNLRTLQLNNCIIESLCLDSLSQTNLERLAFLNCWVRKEIGASTQGPKNLKEFVIEYDHQDQALQTCFLPGGALLPKKFFGKASLQLVWLRGKFITPLKDSPAFESQHNYYLTTVPGSWEYVGDANCVTSLECGRRALYDALVGYKALK